VVRIDGVCFIVCFYTDGWPAGRIAGDNGLIWVSWKYGYYGSNSVDRQMRHVLG